MQVIYLYLAQRNLSFYCVSDVNTVNRCFHCCILLHVYSGLTGSDGCTWRPAAIRLAAARPRKVL